ncbi:MAG TPA: hypothetical protein VJJ28_02605 [Candidatus Paceibacterota bacterium]
MIDTKIVEKIIGGQEVLLMTEDKNEKEIERLVSALRVIAREVNHNLYFSIIEGCRADIDIPQVEERKRALVVSALAQTNLNIKIQEINEN